MTADALKSASITNLDATPVVANTTGAGAPGNLRSVAGSVLPTTGGLGDTGSKYKMVRLPWTAKLKKLTLSVDGALDSSTGLALDVGAYYSDSTVDGTPVALQGTAVDVNYFAAALTGFRSSAVADLNALRGSQFLFAMRNQPLWQALGLSANPGGFCDIVVAVQAAATTAAAAVLGATAEFVD